MLALTQEAFRYCKWMWLGFLAAWLAAAAKAKATEWREGWSSRMAYSIPTLLAALLVFSQAWQYDWLQYQPLPPSEWLAVLGLALTAAGIAIAIWARVYIGANWSGRVTRKVGHELVQSGPYRLVRHPIYSGLLLGMLGTGLTNFRLRSLLGVALLWLGFWIKKSFEEDLMQQTFGSEYTHYKERT